jgi:hypothetical protein
MDHIDAVLMAALLLWILLEVRDIRKKLEKMEK